MQNNISCQIVFLWSIYFFMGRPTDGDEPKIGVNVRLDPALLRELDAIVKAAYSNRSIILQEIVRLGIPEFLKREKDIKNRYEALRGETPKKRLVGHG